MGRTRKPEPVRLKLKLLEDESEMADDYRRRYNHKLYREVYTFHFGNRIVETTVIESDSQVAATAWLRNIKRDNRNRARGGGEDRTTDYPSGPLVVGFAVFRRRSSRLWKKSKEKESIIHIAICVGGAHCLIIELGDYRRSVPCALLPFLSSPRIWMVGVGVMQAARELAVDKGLMISHSTEVKELVELAFRHDPNLGPRFRFPRRKQVGLEELASVALGGIVVRKRPPGLELDSSNWYCMEGENVMYAARDAFLACEIGEKCFEMFRARKHIRW